VFELDDLVGDPHHVSVVRRDHEGHARRNESAEDLKEVFSRTAGELGRGLVRHDELRGRHQRDRESRALLLSNGELAGKASHALGQTELREKLLRSRP
jgi:hypothetical protein